MLVLPNMNHKSRLLRPNKLRVCEVKEEKYVGSGERVCVTVRLTFFQAWGPNNIRLE